MSLIQVVKCFTHLFVWMNSIIFGKRCKICWIALHCSNICYYNNLDIMKNVVNTMALSYVLPI